MQTGIIDKNKAVLPKYQQIRSWLMEKLSSGNYRKGDRFYSENELVRQFRSANLTVRQALGVLESEGFIERRRGSGAFVKRLPEKPERIRITKHCAIGILTGDIEFSDNLALGKIFAELHQCVSEKGYMLYLSHKSVPSLIDAQVDGIMVVGFPTEDNIRQLQSSGIPVVGLGIDSSGVFSSVGSDFESKGRDIVKFFRCRRLMKITAVGSGRDAVFVSDRLLPAMADEVMKFPEMELTALINAPEGEAAALKKQLAGGVRPDAILLMNWLSVSPMLQVIAELKLRIPDDISVLVNGENALALHVVPPLSIISSDLAAECREAVAILCEMIKSGSREIISRKFGHKIVNRGSVAERARRPIKSINR